MAKLLCKTLQMGVLISAGSLAGDASQVAVSALTLRLRKDDDFAKSASKKVIESLGKAKTVALQSPEKCTGTLVQLGGSILDGMREGVKYGFQTGFRMDCLYGKRKAEEQIATSRKNITQAGKKGWDSKARATARASFKAVGSLTALPLAVVGAGCKIAVVGAGLVPGAAAGAHKVANMTGTDVLKSVSGKKSSGSNSNEVSVSLKSKAPAPGRLTYESIRSVESEAPAHEYPLTETTQASTGATGAKRKGEFL